MILSIVILSNFLFQYRLIFSSMHYLWWSKPWFLSIFLKCFGFLKTFFVGWRHARHLWYGQGRPGWPHQAALRSELFRLRREVHHGARGEEERGWDPRPGAGGQRHARQVHHPRPQESEQLQADGWRGVIRISFPGFFLPSCWTNIKLY